MKLFIRGDIPFYQSDFRKVDYDSQLFNSALNFLLAYEKEFEKRPDQFFFMSGLIRQTLSIFERLKLNIPQTTFLDLGCGCDPPRDVPESSHSLYPHKPYFARVMHHLGAKVIGIDQGHLNQEPFTGYSLDLMQPNALKILSDSSIDVVHSRLLGCSPSLDKEYPERKKDLAGILFPQIVRVLRNPGYCISDFHFETLEKVPEFRVRAV